MHTCAPADFTCPASNDQRLWDRHVSPMAQLFPSGDVN